MEELQLALTPTRVDQKNYGLWLKSWQVGQVLQALVTDRLPGGELVLRVGGLQITATTDIPVQKGAVMTLEVKTLTPVPTLTVKSGLDTVAAQADPLRSQLQMLFSRQGKIADPMSTLLDPTRSAKILALLDVRGGALVELIRNAGRFEQLSDPRQLREAVNRSGIFLEPRLLELAYSGKGDLAPDLKADLLRLREQLDQALLLRGTDTRGEANNPLRVFREQVDGAIATISLHQLAAHGPDERSSASWLIHIPFVLQDSAHSLSLAISRDDRARGEDATSGDEWKVLLEVALPTLGPMAAELFLRDKKLSVVLYAELEHTARLLETQMTQLRTALESHGMEVAVLLSHQGSRSAEEVRGRFQQCVDERV